MPLVQGHTDAAISANIAELHRANKDKPPKERRSHDQIVAIALAKARESKGK